MIIDVIGVRPRQYTTTKNGVTREVKGVNAFCLEPITNGGVGSKYFGISDNGRYAPLWISDALIPMENVTTGRYDVEFNQYGNVCSCRSIIASK